MVVNPADFSALTGTILNAAIEVHRTMGPGLLESPYLPAMKYELAARGLRFSTQREIPLMYKGVPLNLAFRIDFLVEDTVIVELKSQTAILPVHQAQLLTYLRIANVPVGLLINFNVPRLMDGVKRVVNPRHRGRDSQQGTDTAEQRTQLD